MRNDNDLQLAAIIRLIGTHDLDAWYFEHELDFHQITFSWRILIDKLM